MRLALLLSVLVLAGCTTAAPTPSAVETPSPFADCSALAKGTAQLPEFALPCFTGGSSVQLGELSGPMVINFWAPWCDPCREELPAFQRLADQGRVTVVGVATDTSRAAATSLAADLNLKMPTLLDIYGELRRKLGEANLPLTLFVDREGKVTRYVGPALNDEKLAVLVKERLGVA